MEIFCLDFIAVFQKRSLWQESVCWVHLLFAGPSTWNWNTAATNGRFSGEGGPQVTTPRLQSQMVRYHSGCWMKTQTKELHQGSQLCGLLTASKAFTDTLYGFMTLADYIVVQKHGCRHCLHSRDKWMQYLTLLFRALLFSWKEADTYIT